MLCFNQFHSTDVEDGRIVFRLVGTDSLKYEFAVASSALGLMAAAIQAASSHLPEYTGPSLIPVSVKPALAGLEPALLIDLGGNLKIGVALTEVGLSELKTAIEQLERRTTPGPQAH